MNTPPSQQLVTFAGTAAIPIGHEIEFFSYLRGGALFTGRYDVLTDLTTGIRYTPMHDSSLAQQRWEEPTARVERHVRGRVLACTIENNGEWSRTTLLVDATPSRAYR